MYESILDHLKNRYQRIQLNYIIILIKKKRNFIALIFYNTNNRIFGLGFIIFCNKIFSYKLSNSQKYPYFLVKNFKIKTCKLVKRVIYSS